MLQITPQMKILVAIEPADFRRGIDAPARLCQETLQHDPFVGTVFVFRNRRATALKVLMYDGRGLLPSFLKGIPTPVVGLWRP